MTASCKPGMRQKPDGGKTGYFAVAKQVILI